MDIILSGAALPLLVPVTGVLALAVMLESPGPVLHRETRLGRHGRRFRLAKLRTFHAGAERRPLVAPPGDPRVTRVGHLLRRTHLDELPQLFHVLAGSMSLVGPRPEPPGLWRDTPAALRKRVLGFRPGMTSPASLRYLCEDAVLAGFPRPESLYRERLLPAKAAEDVRYFEQRTLRTDLYLLLRTLWRLARRGDEACCRRRLLALLEQGDDHRVAVS